MGNKTYKKGNKGNWKKERKMITDIINLQRREVSECDGFCFTILDLWLKQSTSNYLILAMTYKQC